jgi:hypothetical protein
MVAGTLSIRKRTRNPGVDRGQAQRSSHARQLPPPRHSRCSFSSRCFNCCRGILCGKLMCRKVSEVGGKLKLADVKM